MGNYNENNDDTGAKQLLKFCISTNINPRPGVVSKASLSPTPLTFLPRASDAFISELMFIIGNYTAVAAAASVLYIDSFITVVVHTGRNYFTVITFRFHI